MKNKHRKDILRADKAYLQDNNIDFPTLLEDEKLHLTKTQKKIRINRKIHKLAVKHRQAIMHSSSNPIIPPDAIITTTSTTTAAMKVMMKQNTADDNHKNNGTGRDDYDDRSDDSINLLPSAKKKQRTRIQAKASLDYSSFLLDQYVEVLEENMELHAELREKETEIENLKEELHSFQLELQLQPESYNVKKEQEH